MQNFIRSVAYTPVNNYMFKVEIGKTRKRWKIGPKFTMKKPGQRQ